MEEEKKEDITNKIAPETVEEVAAPKTRKPRVNKTTKVVEAPIESHTAAETAEEIVQEGTSLEEIFSSLEKKELKDKKKKKGKKDKDKKKKKDKAKKEKAKAKAKKAKKAKKEKAKKAKLKAKLKEKKAKAKAKKAKKNKKNKKK